MPVVWHQNLLIFVQRSVYSSFVCPYFYSISLIFSSFAYAFLTLPPLTQLQDGSKPAAEKCHQESVQETTAQVFSLRSLFNRFLWPFSFSSTFWLFGFLVCWLFGFLTFWLFGFRSGLKHNYRTKKKTTEKKKQTNETNKQIGLSPQRFAGSSSPKLHLWWCKQKSKKFLCAIWYCTDTETAMRKNFTQ